MISMALLFNKEYAKELAEMIKKNNMFQQKKYRLNDTKVSAVFSDAVNKNRKFPERQVNKLKADPAAYDPNEFEDDEEDEKRAAIIRPRVLWPFSLSITKSKGGHDDHEGPPAHLG